MRTTKQQLATENVALRSRVSELEGLLQRERFARVSMEAEMALLRKKAYAPTKPRGALTIVIDGVERATYLTKQAGIEAMQRIKAALPNAKIFAK